MAQPESDAMQQTMDLVSSKLTNPELVSERHAHLAAAATDLFLRQGFHKTTTREIAAAAGWNMARLYLYISCKEDVLLLVARSLSSPRREGLLALPPQPTATATLRAAAEYYFGIIAQKRRELNFLYRETASMLPEHREVLKQGELQERDFLAAIIRRGSASGEFREVDAELYAHDLILLAHMWALKHWALPTEMSLDKFIERQVDLILTYLRPDDCAPPVGSARIIEGHLPEPSASEWQPITDVGPTVAYT